MGMMSRMATIVKSKMNRVLDNAEDPRETLDYSYEKQLELLRNVKRGVVEMATAKRRLETSAGKPHQARLLARQVEGPRGPVPPRPGGEAGAVWSSRGSTSSSQTWK